MILTLNSGSSSLKFALYSFEPGAGEPGRGREARGRAPGRQWAIGRDSGQRRGPGPGLTLSGKLDRIGLPAGSFQARDARGERLAAQELALPDHEAALERLFAWLEGRGAGQRLQAVGHRVVHGGERFGRPQLITPELLAALRALMPMAPDHLPHELRAIDTVSRRYPALRQVACFDTAFHRSMPRLAQILPLPRALQRKGLIRYGFHGLSYEYIMTELRRQAGADTANGRVIIAHLGNGASMAAVYQGHSVETTMGFTPAGGLVMSTRTGDVDPGALLYLLREDGMDGAALSRLVNEQAGLLGVSGLSSDMKDLLEAEAASPAAGEAIDLFCYQAKKFVGALVAVLGGVDTLIFTGGIGENVSAIRGRIAAGLEFLGIHLDPARNEAAVPVISPDGSPVTVRVMKTNEELIIARQTHRLLETLLGATTAPAGAGGAPLGGPGPGDATWLLSEGGSDVSV